MIALPLLLAALCAALMLGTMGQLWMRRGEGGKESWRDRPPMLFRVARPFVNVFVERVGQSMQSYQRELLQDKLAAAGMSYAVRAEEFVATRRVGLIVGVLLIAYTYLVAEIHNPRILVPLALLVPLGYFYPDIWLRDTIKRRHGIIEKQFPFFLDLLVLSMRAGLNFTSAIAHAVEKMADGPVKSEFERVLRENRTGLTRRESLLNLGRRINLSGVTNFVSVVNQAEEVGGEIGEILVTQAAQRRAERFLKAEKLANQAPVKMLLPLIAFMFPITFIIVMFPIFIKARDSGTLSFFGG